jgi:hypothetical protein
MARKLGNVLILIFICLLYFISSKAQVKKDSVKHHYNQRLQEAADFIENTDNKYQNQYRVFIVSMYKDAGTKDYCFTISYILNSNEISFFINSIYSKTIEDRVYLLKVDSLDEQSAVAQRFGWNLLSKDQRVQVVQKLYPAVLGGFMYDPAFAYGCVANISEPLELFLAKTDSCSIPSIRD